MQDPIRESKPSYEVLRRLPKTTKRINLALNRRLERQEHGFKRSMYLICPRMHAVLLENRDLRIRERQLFIFMLRFT